LKRAPAKVVVLWQVSHDCPLIGMWFDGMTVLARPPTVWQAAQPTGVPLKTPRVWQVSQRTMRCAPVSGKPVPR